uniref:Uncharacterized protein n=1 Tax=Zea mays TaxID=4577 RepID=C0PL99_MAIZE|nr:unknown [Zea mays]
MGTQAHPAVFQEPRLEMLGSPYRLCRTSPEEGTLTYQFRSASRLHTSGAQETHLPVGLRLQ